MKIFFSVGEPSGDLHGANLIRQLRQHCHHLQCIGYGGPRMAAAGCHLHQDLTELAVMWLTQVVRNLHHFWRLLRRAEQYFQTQRPDAVVLIDYPGFNWWIARKAKKYGIPVFYYGVPQMWAWAPWRVRKMRRLVDHVLCKLPFEASWYQQRNCNAVYVGHPYFDQLARQPFDPQFLKDYLGRTDRLVTILPGSRTQEVLNNLPWFLKAAARVRSQLPQTRFAIASLNQKQARLARHLVQQLGVPADVFVGRTAELIHLSHCCMACSGSVSLELLYHVKPSVILYWIKRLPYWVARYLLIRCRYITLVNLIACEDRFDVARPPLDPHSPAAQWIPFPEYPTHQDKSEELAMHVVQWLTDRQRYSDKVRQLEDLKAQLAHAGASQMAAQYILQALDGTVDQVPPAAAA